MQKPENELEEALARIWSEAIGIPEIGRDENFFDLGGHSVIAIEIVTRIHYELGLDCSHRDFTLHPTVAQLAESIAASLAERLSPELLAQV